MRNPNGYGSIHKLSGNRRNPWRVRKTIGWSEDNKQLFANIGYYKTRKEAMEALANYNVDPWDVNSKEVTFDEIYQIILKKKEQEVTPQSFKIIKSNYKHTQPLWGKAISQLKTQHLQSVIDNLDKSVAIKRKVRTAIKDVFTYCMKNDIIRRDYSALVEIGKEVKATKDRKPFSNDELRNIYENKNNGFVYEVALLLIFSGFRINELLKMEIESVNLEKGVMIGGSKTEAGKDRHIPISKHTKDIVEKYYTLNKDKKYLLSNTRGNYHNADNLRIKWNEIFPDHTFHECRHTFSSICNNAEVNKLTQQRLLGHSSDNITDRVYTHKSLEDFKLAMTKFDTYMDKVLCI